ncbi:drug resistance transporter, EmrB/QacA subfamily [Paramicrobacterium humi]|uniref:Drug resistance transporter, EmrB/QacA subfamily n=1 Tax=Paramicrobacterium humi TaxID=640635 RepID=A0A1H4NX07_9MICO|nr:MFS transporter [Microbacterium humi]SEB99182.1 drug resistance transporter, EmrB/QacA subfamily [Microbacterium humi]
MRNTRERSLVLILVSAQFVVMLDSSILNVALPSITSTFGLTAVGTAWVLNAYFLSFGGLLLVSGRAADVFGRRRMYLAGSAVLVAGSVLGGFSSTDAVLIASRLAQGAGAAMLSPAAMAVLLSRYSGAARTGAMSHWGAASTVGGAVGVTAGGLLTAWLGWQSVLFVTGAVAALVGAIGLVLLPPDDSTTTRRFDAAGAALLTGASVAAVLAILAVPDAGFGSIEVLAPAALFVGCLVSFVLVERHAADPILQPAALSDRRVAGGIAANVLGGSARIACFVLVALLLQQVLEYDAGRAGLAMLPTSIAGFAVSTMLLPRALKKWGPEKIVVVGLGLLVVAHLLLSTVDRGNSYLLIVLPALVLAAAGVAFSFTPTTLVIANGMAARNAGVSSGLSSATAQIGGAIGMGIFGAIDAANRAGVLDAGGTSHAAAEAGLWSAHLAAAALAACAAVIALCSFPSLRRAASPASLVARGSAPASTLPSGAAS